MGGPSGGELNRQVVGAVVAHGLDDGSHRSAARTDRARAWPGANPAHASPKLAEGLPPLAATGRSLYIANSVNSTEYLFDSTRYPGAQPPPA